VAIYGRASQRYVARHGGFSARAVGTNVVVKTEDF